MVNRPSRRKRIVACSIWTLAAAITAYYAISTWVRRATFTATYPYSNDVLTDFRDTAILPNMALQRGIDPYNIGTYRAAFPHAQEFDPYMPWWLSATHPLTHLNWNTSALLWSIATATLTTLMAIRATVLGRRRIKHSTLSNELKRSTFRPRFLTYRLMLLSAPIAATWVWIWRPTSIGQGLGNVGAVAALAALLSIWEERVPLSAMFLAISWVKPQFGIPVSLVLCITHRYRHAFAGTILAALASTPTIIHLDRIEGGLSHLVRTAIDSATSLNARTGGEPLAGRVDLTADFNTLGIAGHSTIAMAVGMTGLALAAAAMRSHHWPFSPKEILLLPLAVTVSLPHIHYDLAILAVPALLALIQLPEFHDHTAGIRRIMEECALILTLCAGILPASLFFGGARWAQLQAASILIAYILLMLSICCSIVTNHKSTTRGSLKRELIEG